MARGRHRARRGSRAAQIVAFLLGLAAAATAGTLAVVATDARLLRGAVVAALLAAVATTVGAGLEPRPARADGELRALRLELARLRGELDAHLAIARLSVPPQRAVPVALPPARPLLPKRPPAAAAHRPGRVIDLTERTGAATA